MSKLVPTYAEFIARFPVFQSLQQPTVEAEISLSARTLSKLKWGDFFSDGIILDAAHSLSINNAAQGNLQGGQQLAAGPIVSSSGAGISVSFANPDQDAGSKTDSWYVKTVYGQQFLRLRDTVIPCGTLST